MPMEHMQEIHVPAHNLVPKVVELTTSAATLITSTEARPVTISTINFCNKTAGAQTVDLIINDGTSDFYVREGLSIAAHDSELVSGPDVEFMRLNVGWSVKALASANSAIDLVGNFVVDIRR